MNRFKTLKEALAYKGKVKLVDDRYAIGNNNPLVGTSFECEGVVVGKITGRHNGVYPLNVEVKWDNGTDNHYNFKDLVIVEAPNKTKTPKPPKSVKLDTLYG